MGLEFDSRVEWVSSTDEDWEERSGQSDRCKGCEKCEVTWGGVGGGGRWRYWSQEVTVGIMQY